MRIAAVCLCILMPLLLIAQKKITLTSPDKNLVFNFYNDDGNAAYSVAYKKQVIINKSFLSLEFKDGSFSQNLKTGKPVYYDSTEDYDLFIGKTSHVHDAYKEVIIPLQSADKRIVELAVKAFNDGIAFQYRFKLFNNKDEFELTDENRQLNIPLSFLKDGNPPGGEANYTATIYSDADDVTTEPNHLKKETKEVTAKDILNVKVAGGGGAAIWVKKNQ